MRTRSKCAYLLALRVVITDIKKMKVIKFFGDHPPVLTQMLYSIQQDQLLFFRKRCVPIIIAAKKVLKHENIVNFLQYLFKIYSLAGGRLLLLGGHSAA